MMKESNILKQIMIEAGKRGFIALRLNSGKFYQGNIKQGEKGQILENLRHIMGTPEGTADVLIIEDKGKVTWCETKTATGSQRQSQKNFQQAVENLGHKYILARKISDIF